MRTDPGTGRMSEAKQGILGEFTFRKFLAGAVVFPIFSAMILPDAVKETAKEWTFSAYDKVWCEGRAALEEGHKMSRLAIGDLAQAQTLFAQANTHYRKAHACGIPEAGLRLAMAHCQGLGEPKSVPRGRQLIVDTETAFRDRADIMRWASDVRQKVCDAP
jgi:hypothetical protein